MQCAGGSWLLHPAIATKRNLCSENLLNKFPFGLLDSVKQINLGGRACIPRERWIGHQCVQHSAFSLIFILVVHDRKRGFKR